MKQALRLSPRYRRFLLWILSLCTGWGYSTAYGQVADFTAGQTSGCSPLTVQFAQQATGAVTTYFWDFGNGNTSTLPNPGVIYVNPGTYTVTLTVSDGSNSNSETKTGYITVFADPVADFSLSPVGGCVPFPVTATDLSAPGDGVINQWTWDFGDGTISNQSNPNHTYQTAGMYDVSLTVTDANGCSDTRLIPDLVSATSPLQVSANSSLPSLCQLPYTVDFSSSVNGGGNYTYKWDFGDGGSSNLPNPTHSYTQAGNYTVTLVTTEAGGCTDTLILIDEVSIAFPQASFVVSDTVVCAGENLNLINLSTGGTQFEWNFGDGTVFNGPNPQHAYQIPGTYPIRLIARNAQGCADTMVRINYITVSPSPVANFGSGNPQACSAPWLVNFNDASQGSSSWLWDFGDGNTANIANPSHLYSQAGFYTVSLITIGANGCRDTLTRPNYVQIVPPIAEFVADTVEGCIPLDVDFQDLSTSAFDSIDTWIWDFGDGGSSFQASPSHTFNSVGIFQVSLIVVTQGGCRDTSFLEIQAGTPPVVNFNSNPNLVCATDPVSFLDQSSLATEWTWFFGDGGMSNVQNPIYTYGDTGFFDVTLIASYYGCQDTLVKPNCVRVLPPIAEFTTNPLFGCEVPLTVSFNDLSIGADHWFWDFGDGTQDSVQFPTHTYTALGSYTVTLTVVNDSTGCTDDFVYEFNITNPQADFAIANGTTCIGNQVSFSNNSTGASSYLWLFGDGDSSTLANPTHGYASAGNFDVTLIAINDIGCQDTMVISGVIDILGPMAEFSVDTTTGCAPLDVIFTNQSQAITPGSSITGYFWDFGDGTTSTAPNPIHQFVDPGDYTITLVAIDDQGCTDTLIRTGYIQPTFPTAAFTTDDTLTCPGAPVSFINLSTGVGNTYEWNFGDGTSSNVASPVKIYPGNSGQFTVTLIATDVNGCQSISTLSDYVAIGPPVALFNAAPTQQACPPLTVNFTNQSSPNVAQWSWDFGDGSTSSLPNPSKVYNLPGQYDVSLVVTTAQGCQDTLDLPGLIELSGPQGSFSFTPQSGCSPLEVIFNANTQGAATWTWDFGDGNLGFGQNVTHTYLQDTIARPVLVIEDTAGCTVAIPAEDSIVVRGGPIPDFQILQSQTCIGEPIQLINLTTSPLPIISYEWDLGDGNTSQAANPQHAYTQAGSYLIQLTATNLSGCSDSLLAQIPIQVAPRPQASFIPSQIQGCAPLTVTFNGQSGGGSPIILRSWDFGDGDTASTQSPLHTFVQPGTYTVSLTVTDANGCQDTIQQDIEVIAAPIPDFTLSATDGCAPRSIQFTDLSQGNVSQWFWDFGDGDTSTQANPIHTYQVDGQFDVSLTVTNAQGCAATLLEPDLIELKRPAASFTSIASNLCPPALVQFDAYANADSSIAQWYWDFGNGDTAVGSNPSYVYLQAGNFDVQLIVVDSLGCQDTLLDSQHVSILTPPSAQMDLSDSMLCAPGQVTFSSSSLAGSSPITSTQWNLGNGQSGPGVSLTGIFPNAGTYQSSLIVTDANGCQDTAFQSVTVHPPLVADFTVSDSTGCAQGPIDFFDLSNSPSTVVSWLWDFGDGQSSTSASPTHVYDSVGTYDVTLLVVDQFGCQDSLTKPNLIQLEGPTVSFSPLQTTACPGTSISFTDASQPSNSLVSWQWDFGDGDSSSQQNPTHTYLLPGIYQVSLRVEDQNGCEALLSVPQAVIIEAGPVASFTPDLSQGCAPLEVNFSDASSSSNSTLISWQYDFDNGNGYNFPHASQTFQTPGLYQVTLTVSDAKGCVAVDTQQVEVWEGPSASFITNLQSGCAPRPVDFLSQSGGPYPLSNWSWDFGDGNSGTGPLATHTYQNDGLYDVTLRVTDINGCQDSLTQVEFLRIGGPLIDFGVDDSLPCPGELVTFTDFSQPDTPIVNWFWDFGDGNTGVGSSPSHSYADSGTYDISLTVIDVLGCSNTLVKPELVKVRPRPVAYFMSPEFSCAPAIVVAQDSSHGMAPINTWTWRQDGLPSGGGQQAQFFLNQAGSYTLTLRVVDDFGCTDTFSKEVEVFDPPQIDFRASDTVGCASLAVVFQGQSDPTGVNWLWDFGDGDSAIGPAPVHTYLQDGSYDVTLQVEDRYGCTASLSKPQYIKLSRPLADFNIRYVPACPPVEATFTAAASSPYGIQSYQWELGDGTALTGNPVVHQYQDTGNYVVSLTVVDGLGCDQVVIKDTAVSIFGQQKPTPISIYAASVNEKEAIRLSWRPSSALDFGAYLVFWQNPSNGNWEQIHETSGRNDSVFLDRRPAILDCESQSYCYIVIQRNQCGTQGSLNEAKAHCTVEIEANSLADRILVEWNAYQGWSQVDHYEVYRVSDYQQSFDELLALVPGSDLSYVDDATSCFNQYSYRILAVGNQSGQVAWSDTTRARNEKSQPTQSAEIFTATVPDNQNIEVYWENPQIPDLIETFLERSEDQGLNWITLASLPLSQTQYRDTSAGVQEQSYWYRIRYRDSCGFETPYSNLGKSIHLQAGGEEFTNELSWTPYEEWANGVDYYRIEVRNEASGVWQEVDVVAANTLTYLDRSTFLDQGQYCYRITGYEQGGNQAQSISNEACTGVNPKIYVPNVFTPNGDGINETFFIKGVYLKEVHIQIFSRWGILLWQGNGLEQGWNGQHRGEELPEGVYTYRIEAVAQNGERFRETGTVSLIR